MSEAAASESTHVETLAGAIGSPAVVIRVRDIPGLIKAQGGGIGEFVQKLAPNTIQDTVYNQMAAEIMKGMKEKGVNADVQVMDLPQTGPGAPTPHATDNTIRNVALGVGAFGALGLVYYFFGRSPKAVR